MEYLTDNISARQEKLLFYSSYNMIREINKDFLFDIDIYKRIIEFSSDSNNQIIEIEVKNQKHFFLVSYLAWDSNYFKVPSYKLFTVLYGHTDFKVLSQAVLEFKKVFFISSPKYIFIEIPSEDTLLIQALTERHFKLIETRLTYFRGDLHKFENKRFPVRRAEVSDIPNLKRVASEMRNIYDRFHADSFFNQSIADQYLATYVEQSILGFADIVLTCNSENVPSDAFLTAKYLKEEWEKLNSKVSKMVLSAVSVNCKGWYYKLISEMTYHLREVGAEYIFMNTQTTNRAVFKTWENLGYQLGCTTHILSSNT